MAAATEHPGLVTHARSRLTPLGLQDDTPFLNLMTSRLEAVGDELGGAGGGADQGGGVAVELLLLARGASAAGVPVGVQAAGAGGRGDRVVLAVRCPACGRSSLNLVSREHVDVPFVNDREVGVVEHVFHDDAASTVEEFQAELYSASFDARRLNLG